MQRPIKSQRVLLLGAALALLAGCGAPPTTPAAAPPDPTRAAPQPAGQRRMVVIDTDMAVDDWLAILYLLQRADVQVTAISVTGTGEAHCAQGVEHALGLLALARYDKLPVACGRETPLQGSHAFPSDWRDRVDSLLGLTLPASQERGSSLNAPELLASVIQGAPGKVTVLTLGPLTNVAQALQDDPALINNIAGIYIMGGAVKVPGSVGRSGVTIDNQVAEWNIYVDPAAANIVFRSGAPVVLVPLDATNQVPLTLDYVSQVERRHTSPEAAFVSAVLNQQKQLIDYGYFFWDPLAAAILTDESLATYENAGLCVVENDGPESGWTKAGDGCPPIRVAVSADRGRFEQVFLDTLNTP